MKFPWPKPSFKLRHGFIVAIGMHAVWVFGQSLDTQEVLVQSGRLAQRQFDAPASVYAIDGQTIRNSGPQVNLSDVLNQAPGVVAFNRNNYAQDVQISIRGFGARSAFGLRGFRLITDGIPATTPDGQGQASTVSLTSADRIEVLTGPLAQLYGNSAGGVIQVFTREAEAVPTLQSQIVMGSHGLSRTDWQFSQRSGQVSFVGDYSTFHIQGYRAHSEAKREQINTLMRIDVSPQTRIKLLANLFSMPYAKDPLGLTLAQVLANPLVAAFLFASSLVVFYFTPIFGWATREHLGHQWMIVHFVITGYLFVQALVGVDPGPVNLGYPQRLMLLIATLAFHAFFGLALMNGQTLLLPEWFGAMGRTWGEPPLIDQQTGGAIAWGIGEIPTAALTLMVAIQWARSDKREAKRLDRASDRSGNQDLAEYNEWLERINKGK